MNCQGGVMCFDLSINERKIFLIQRNFIFSKVLAHEIHMAYESYI
jgi:hypothetical protein